MSSATTSICVAALAFAVRLVFHPLAETLRLRPEISTPLTSLHRLNEGAFLFNATGDPYAGSVFHQPPLFLLVARLLAALPAHPWAPVAAFAVVDAISACLLAHVAAEPTAARPRRRQLEAGLLYAVNPFAVAACVGASTAVLSNAFVIAALFFVSRRPTPWSSQFAAMALAVATYSNIYWGLLAIPLLLFSNQFSSSHQSNQSNQSPIHSTNQSPSTAGCHLSLVLLFVGCLGVLALLSTGYVGSWRWLSESYVFQASVQELTPNLGTLWYLFTEMFDEYRAFFHFGVQAFVPALAVPLCIRFRRDPLALCWLLVSAVVVLRPYLSAAELALQLGLLALLRDDLVHVAHKSLMLIVAAALALLAPILHHTWLYTGTGNANFYFAVCIVLAFLQVCLVPAVADAVLVRHYRAKIASEPSPPPLDKEVNRRQ